MRFEVIGGKAISDIVSREHKRIVEIIGNAYLSFYRGNAVNPNSHFLRFDKRKDARIIALPAHIDDDVKLSGIKWISSFPSNLKRGIPRASAVLVLNDYETGYPFACLESSIISAARTAASAVLAGYHLNEKNKKIATLGIVGTGLISRYILDFFMGCGWDIERICLYDVNHEYVDAFRQRAILLCPHLSEQQVVAMDSAEALIAESDIIVFATTADAPHISDLSCFQHAPLILHVSLRDLSPSVVLASHNVVDDVEHCLKAKTSLHLTEEMTGHRSFIFGTLAEILAGGKCPQRDRPIVFSPFGMGILDLALGNFVYQLASKQGHTQEVADFFYDMTRV